MSHTELRIYRGTYIFTGEVQIVKDVVYFLRFNAVDVLNEESSQVLCDELPPLLLKHGKEADVLEKLLKFVQVCKEIPQHDQYTTPWL